MPDKRKRKEEGQTTVYKTQHNTEKIEQHEPH